MPRMEVSTMRSVSLNKVVELLESMRQENAVLKDCQDMLFKKQDIIQYTLAGDIKVPTSQTPSSPSAPSVLAWLPVPNSFRRSWST